MSKKILGLPLLVSLLLLTACHQHQPVPTEKLEKFASGEEQLGCHLFRELAKKPEKENFFFCPTSLMSGLAVTATGANGATYTNLMKTLGLPADWTQSELSDVVRESSEQFVLKRKVQLVRVANCIVAPAAIKLNDGFRNEASQNLNCAIIPDSPESNDAANKWVSEKTMGAIPSVEIPRTDNQAVLLNTVFFKGTWLSDFPPAQTNLKFHNENGTNPALLFMGHLESYEYLETSDFQMARLPFGYEQYATLLILPKGKKTISEISKQITPENLEKWVAQMKTKPLDFMMPKFHITYKQDLSPELKTLGLKNVFESNADLSGMFETRGTSIPSVFHQTILDVNEEGVTAAAVTAQMCAGAARPPDDLITFQVDHPFIFILHEQQHRRLLFMGCIRNL